MIQKIVLLYSLFSLLAIVEATDKWPDFLPLIENNLEKYHEADHILFTHIPKTGGNELASDVFRPLVNLYKIRAVRANNGVHDQIEAIATIEKACKSDCNNVKWFYGHSVQYEFKVHEVIFNSSNFRYVTMIRDPINRLISLFYHFHDNKINESYPNNFLDFSEQEHETHSFLHYIPNFNRTDFMEIISKNYLILLNEEYLNSVKMLTKVLKYENAELTINHKNSAATHMIKRNESLILNHQDLAIIREWPSIKKQYEIYHKLIAIFSVQKQILLND